MICERALQPASNYPTVRPAGKRKIGKNRPRTNLACTTIQKYSGGYSGNLRALPGETFEEIGAGSLQTGYSTGFLCLEVLALHGLPACENYCSTGL